MANKKEMRLFFFTWEPFIYVYFKHRLQATVLIAPSVILISVTQAWQTSL